MAYLSKIVGRENRVKYFTYEKLIFISVWCDFFFYFQSVCDPVAILLHLPAAVPRDL